MEMTKGKWAVIGVGVALIVFLVIIMGIGRKGGGDSGYLVRADFANAVGLEAQGDVRIGGANAGHIKAIEITPDDRAAVILDITDPAFQHFYKDARCQIRLQSLIGEKFVDCQPGTDFGTSLPPAPGHADQVQMSVNSTDSPVDIDLNLDVLRQPTRARLRTIFNEFGAALAGRGDLINKEIHIADPALFQLDRLLAILARNNKELADLAKNGDTSLKSLASVREHIVGLIRSSSRVQNAVASRQGALRATLRQLPPFFDQLEPTAKKLKEFSIAAQPISAALHKGGTDASTFISNTSDFAKAANKGLTAFANTTPKITDNLPAFEQFATNLNKFASYKSSEKDLAGLLTSFEKNGGYANLMTLTIGIVGAMNGFDSYGHFVRSALVTVGACFQSSRTRTSGCPNGDFLPDSISEPSSGSASTAALDYLMGSGN